jgi:hypothetical protein
MAMRILLTVILLLFVCSSAHAASFTASASRTSGTAPLSVFFNADLVDSNDTTQNFHNLHYTWNYGDPGSGAWGTNGKSRNADNGAIGFHVYETPGTYTATVTVINPNTGATVDSESFTVTVASPDTTFAGPYTTCFSNDSTFTGCPAGATQVPNTVSLNGISSYFGNNRRVLLARGDTFTATSQLSLGNMTTMHFGAFGTCTSADSSGRCNNAPTLQYTNNSTWFIDVGGKNDFRIVDLNIVMPETSTAKGIIEGAMGTNTLLLLRNRITGGSSTAWENWRQSESVSWVGNAIVDSYISKSYGVGLFIGGDRLGIIGSTILDSFYSHAVRVWWAHIARISHNYIAGSRVGNTNPNGQQGLKVHGPITPSTVADREPCSATWQITMITDGLNNTDCTTGGGSTYVECDCITTDGNGWQVYRSVEESSGQSFAAPYSALDSVRRPKALPYSSQWIIASDNIIGASGSWPVGFTPQNAIHTEQMSDVLFERNKYIYQGGTPSSDPVSIGLDISARYSTVRNNIFDATGGAGHFEGIYVGRRGNEKHPRWMRVYNNTIYSNTNHATWSRGVSVGAGATDVVVRNNLVSFPASSNDDAVYDATGAATDSNNIPTNTPYFADPNNATPLSRSFALTTNSTAAIDAGYTVPVRDDYPGVIRSGLFDVGAYEYGGSTCGPTDLGACLTEAACDAAAAALGGEHWYDGSCHADAYVESPVCGPTRRYLCTIADCATTGEGYWYGDECNAETEPTPVTRTLRQSATGTIRQTASGTVTQ